MRIGKNSWGCPLFSILPPDEKLGWPWRMTINEGGNYFSALWLIGRELILAFNIWFFCGTIHWHVDWGWKPEIKKIDVDNEC
jgi:hypothetical protein